MSPISNTDGIDGIELNMEEQVFGEPKPQKIGLVGKKRTRGTVMRSRKRLLWSYGEIA